MYCHCVDSEDGSLPIFAQTKQKMPETAVPAFFFYKMAVFGYLNKIGNDQRCHKFVASLFPNFYSKTGGKCGGH